MAEEYKSLHPLKYYRDYFAHDIRPDGREFADYRPVIVNVGSISTADGSAIAKVGKTTVICGVKAELCRPRPECPNKGFLVPNLELSPLCSSKFKSGPPGEEAQVLTQLIADVIENSRCINLEELCLLKDKLAWCLYADLVCLDYDGSLLDACIVALMACLRSVTLPHIDYDPALDVKQTNLQERRHIAQNPANRPDSGGGELEQWLSDCGDQRGRVMFGTQTRRQHSVRGPAAGLHRKKPGAREKPPGTNQQCCECCE
ncbi:hypothetical protein YQE_02557, partial [Dendroctonus ponderosae]